MPFHSCSIHPVPEEDLERVLERGIDPDRSEILQWWKMTLYVSSCALFYRSPIGVADRRYVKRKVN